jgi:glycosyltransferase involved in cell wall biosynthesis
MKANFNLSVVIITKDEEKNIGRCLESIKDIADEIIIIDSFSTDKTREICSAYRVKFLTREWLGYTETKNFGNSLATGEYILSLDADEELSAELKSGINHLKNSDNLAEAYSFNRLTSFCGRWIRHGGWYPDRKIRLWKKDTAYWEGLVHEKLVLENKSAIEHLRGDILHHSYYSINDYLKQMIRYTDLAAEENLRRGKKAPLIRLILSPFSKFIGGYFLRAGFLDGFSGLTISILSSTATYLKYAKTRQLYKQKE